MTEPDTPNGFTNSTTYTYDGIHQILTVRSQTASGTQNRSFAYSGRDMTRATNPENGSVFYTYDGAHHVLSKTDAIGQQTWYSYDAYGRLTAKYCYPLVNGQLQLDPNQTVLYYYDTNPHEPTFSTNSQGYLTAVQMNSSWWYEYNYTVPGRVQDQRLQVAGLDYDASYVWDQEGRLSSQTWPSAVSPSTGPQYQFQYDSMGRVGSMQDTSENTLATATYGVANELLLLTYFGINETLTYNSMFQLIHQYAPGGVINMQYIYTAGQNNGRIASSIDGGLPETVNYTYDSLNRLVNAAATDGAFSQSYTYDGFGNLTSKSAAGFYPAYSATFNPANNQQNLVAYDANGNQTQQGTYDVSNRLVTSSIGQSYNYDYRGKRIVKRTGGTAELYFYGINGKKLTTFQCDSNLNCSSPAYNVSFAGKLVQSKGYTVATDRLGSVRWTAGPVGYVYFPYGEERTISPDDTEKFGTYTRDSSGQDCADQRYYGVGTGRFWSADSAPASLANPGSLNKYTYANGDPVNWFDPTGTEVVAADGGCVFSGVDEDGALTYDCSEVGGGGGDSPYTFSTTVTSATATATAPPDPDPQPTDPTTGEPPESPVPPVPPPQPPSTPQPTTPPPSCTVQVGYLPHVLHSPFSHAYIDVTSAAIGTEYIEASPTLSLRYLSVMKVNITSTGIYNDATQGTGIWSETGPGMCIDVVTLLEDASSFPLSYYLLLTSNSNSFASTLLAEAGLMVGAPPRSIGWGDPVVPIFGW